MITDIDGLLAVLVPILVGFVGKYVYNGLKRAAEKVAELGTAVNLIASTLVNFAIGFLATKLGISPDSITLGPLSPEVVNGVISVFAAAALFHIQKKKAEG